MCKFFRYERITGLDDADYLDRWTLLSLSKGRKIYLHLFLNSDWRDLHDHPKSFWSIGIWGGYIEQTPDGIKRWLAPWIRRFGTDHIHRIRINPKRKTWTIVITSPATAEWGFYTGKYWLRWDRYLKIREQISPNQKISDFIDQGMFHELLIPRKKNDHV